MKRCKKEYVSIMNIIDRVKSSDKNIICTVRKFSLCVCVYVCMVLR